MNRKEHNLPDDSHKHLINMKKTLLNLAFLSLLALVATGCSSDEEYNADTAISYYKPLEYDRMVSSIEIAYKKGNMNNSWKYDFTYDVQNRINEINGTMNYYSNAMSSNNAYVKYEGTVQTKYFYNNETLKIECIYNTYAPKYDKTKKITPKFYGCFDKDGKLISFDSFDCTYDAFQLTRAYTDYGTIYGLEYDRNLNITKAYLIDSLGKPDPTTIRTYEYSTKTNYTNIDFASFFGYNIIERLVDCNIKHPYELFHLGAFGMLGSRGKNLPKGEWEFAVLDSINLNSEQNERYPIKYTSSHGFIYTIKYKE